MPHGVTFGRPTAPEGLRGLESCTNALSSPKKLLISYHVKTFDFFDHFANADIYRPRFIELPLP